LLAVAACTTKAERRPDTSAPASATLAGAPAPDAAAVRRGIEAMNSQRSDALLKGDTAAVVGFFADSAIAMFTGKPAAHGHDAIVKLYGGHIAAKLSAVKYETRDVVVAGDYAIETGAYDMTAAPPKVGAKPLHDVGKYVVVWQRQSDGSYKILRDIGNTDLP
jgi:ketosteroid isomerase-like protein